MLEVHHEWHKFEEVDKAPGTYTICSDFGLDNFSREVMKLIVDRELLG